MIPVPTLDDAISILRNNEEFKVLVSFISDEREAFIGQLRQSETPNDVMKLSGSIATLDELLSLINK